MGTAPKASVHHDATPLHLAFSCYIFNQELEHVLLTQRAWSKQTWPGVWTNSCCGHPPTQDKIAGHVSARVFYELGLAISTPKLVLPDFRYRATMANGIVENEICPVYTAITTEVPVPNPSEVADYRWVRWSDLCAQVAAGELHLSDWCMLQIPQLADLPDLALRYGTSSKSERGAGCGHRDSF